MGRILVQGEENVLEIGHGGDYTTLWMYLMSLNYTLEVVNMVKSYMYFTIIKNIFRSY